MSSKKVKLFIRTTIKAGACGPQPPTGPHIGNMGINIMSFSKEFNARTDKVLRDIPMNTDITLYEDKSYKMDIFSPPSSYFILRVAGLRNGSSRSMHNKGQISLKAVYEIAKLKKSFDPDLDHVSLKSYCKTIIASARSCGVVVVRELDPDFVPYDREFHQL